MHIFARAKRAGFTLVVGSLLATGASAQIDEIIVTDSIPLRDEIKSIPKVKQLTLSNMLAEAIRRVSNEESISAMFEY